MNKVKFPVNLLQPIKLYLQKKEALLKERKKELQREDPFTDTDRINDNAAIDAEAAEQFGHERVEAMRREVDKALINIKKTFTRIKLGKYGICESCGRMIDTDRLAIEPTASLCMRCQQQKSVETETNSSIAG